MYPPLVDVLGLLVDLVCRVVTVLLHQAVGEREHRVDLLIVGVHRRDERLVTLDQVLRGLQCVLQQQPSLWLPRSHTKNMPMLCWNEDFENDEDQN